MFIKLLKWQLPFTICYHKLFWDLSYQKFLNTFSAGPDWPFLCTWLLYSAAASESRLDCASIRIWTAGLWLSGEVCSSWLSVLSSCFRQTRNFSARQAADSKFSRMYVLVSNNSGHFYSNKLGYFCWSCRQNFGTHWRMLEISKPLVSWGNCKVDPSDSFYKVCYKFLFIIIVIQRADPQS